MLQQFAPDWASLWPVLVSPVIGSFLGVLILRLPASMPVIFSRSACHHCATFLRPVDLIPLVSFAWSRGLCRHCGAPIGWFHPAVELAALGVALWVTLAEAAGWIGCGLGWTLLALAWMDWRDMLLPDVLTLPLLLAGLTFSFFLQPDALLDHTLAAVLAFALFEGVAFVYRHVRGLDGLGGGDAKLFAAAGAWCGLGALPAILLGSALTGLVLAASLRLCGEHMTRQTRIPFGPCIAFSFWLVWLYGPSLSYQAGWIG
jgi:leader peptidase (prepilin peptidase)/N-methyltransferase